MISGGIEDIHFAQIRLRINESLFLLSFYVAIDYDFE